MKLLKEPLVHFVILGALLFIGFEVLNEGEERSDSEILITQARIENISQLFSRTWRREPTEKELKNLIDEYIKEEILYREGLSMGLDQNDIVIRRRVKQKVEFLAEDAGSLTEPEESVLAEYLEANADKYKKHPNFTFKHVFFSFDKHGVEAEKIAESSLEKVSVKNWSSLGDHSIAIDQEFEEYSLADIARTFGNDFATEIEGVSLETWKGPIESGYGHHLVFVEKKEEGRVPELREIREVVLADYQDKVREDFLNRLYVELKSNYQVSIEEKDSASSDGLVVSSANAEEE